MAQAAIRTEIDRLSTDREKTGVALGAEAINPVNGERIPIYIADYVLAGYGTGAIMAVPAHDERDYAFAVAYGLPIRRVVASRVEDADAPMDEAFIPHAGGEVLVNSGPYTGQPADEGGRGDPRELEARGKGTASVTYRLHDWLISRQRYWGTPIPVIYCERDGIVPVPEEELPVRLPDTVDYRGSGENPLNRDEAFLNVTCPVCGGPAKRETDTMDTFIDSSWYWYRYLSPGEGRRADRSRPRRRVDPGRPVHRRCRARGHAPAVRPRVDEDDARRRAGRAGRAVQAAVQPGPDPGPRRRADVEVARQHRRPRRPGRPLRRRHGQAVPDVHGPVGPGRAMEPDRDRWRAPLPQSGLDPGHRSQRPRAGRSGVWHPARRPVRRPMPRRRSGPPRTRPCATSPAITRRSTST